MEGIWYFHYGGSWYRGCTDGHVQCFLVARKTEPPLGIKASKFMLRRRECVICHMMAFLLEAGDGYRFFTASPLLCAASANHRVFGFRRAGLRMPDYAFQTAPLLSYLLEAPYIPSHVPVSHDIGSGFVSCQVGPACSTVEVQLTTWLKSHLAA